MPVRNEPYGLFNAKRRLEVKKRLPQANIKNNKDHYLNGRGYHVINLHLTPTLYQNLKSTATTDGLPVVDIIKMAIVQYCKGE